MQWYMRIGPHPIFILAFVAWGNVSLKEVIGRSNAKNFIQKNYYIEQPIKISF